MAIAIELIKKLRESSGAGISDCKNALEKAEGDLNKATDLLREKGLALAAKRSSRAASEGFIEVYTHQGNGRLCVMVEVNSETDFVGRSPSLRNFAHEVALQIASASPLYISEADIPAADIEHEKAIATARAKEEGKPEAIVPKIVEGYLKKFLDETVLLRQANVRDESVTIQDMLNALIAKLGEKIIIRRFVRWQLGEGTSVE